MRTQINSVTYPIQKLIMEGLLIKAQASSEDNKTDHASPKQHGFG